MLSRLSSHVRHNVVGYIALFFALTGVAYAAGPLKSGDPAGGDLAGTYPDPTIGAGKVTNGKLANPSLSVNPGTGLTGGGSVALGGSTTLGVANGGIGTTQFSSTIPAVRVIAPGSTSVPNDTSTTLAFDEDYDTADLHSTTTNTSRLTAPVSGIYRVTAQANFSPLSGGYRSIFADVTRVGGGGGSVGADVESGDADSLANVLHSAGEIKLAAGDFVEIRARQTSGGTMFPIAFAYMSWVAPG